MQSSFADLEYTAKKKATRRDRFLSEIERVTPWSALVAEIEPFHLQGKGRRRPPIGLARMHIAQQCFGLSDEGTADAIYDSQAIRSFVGIDPNSEAAPDGTTLLKFRHLLHGQEKVAFGDPCYPWVEKREITMRPGKRKALPHPLIDRLQSQVDHLQSQVEQIKASIRAKVAPTFKIVKNLFGLKKVRYRGLAKNTAQLYTLFDKANLLIAKRRLFELDAQAAS